MYAATIITFLLNPLPEHNEKLPRAWNPEPCQEYVYFSKSVFLVTLAAPDKEFPSSKSFRKVNGHKFIS